MRKAAISIAVALAFPAMAQAAGMWVDNTATNADPTLLNAAVFALKNQFRDPESIQLRKLRMSDDPNAICGQVNAKNGFGGYTGFAPFFYKRNAQEAGILNPDFTISAKRKKDLDVSRAASEAMNSEEMERLGCIEKGRSASIWKAMKEVPK